MHKLSAVLLLPYYNNRWRMSSPLKDLPVTPSHFRYRIPHRASVKHNHKMKPGHSYATKQMPKRGLEWKLAKGLLMHGTGI